MTSLVMSFIGRDKPGLVGLLSKTIAEHKGNWLESGMSRLGGQFAGILVIQVPQEEQEALIEALKGLESQGLKVSVERSEQSEDEAPVRAVTLDLIGHDKPGIVRDISRALAEMQINVHKMQTELTSGSMSGELLFKASAELQVPTPVDLDELQERLEAIASDLMVDITLN
ncbi:hypothetical protein GCM10011352_40110 [Marinobacterium zhoushanense]|uniref:Glycine cleavage system transcriptional repressor n=1 Tax=Marinobacterium zhoushanense TaxID=1679163 RepID=A0ABQ1KSI7_9GAMM|nr:ACT domain-containing protein [Marinobacterium zhoushanense]GGC09638.1 hypothetical protein GCM10011352_40110 [Marinobacterium zhoushanense]